MDPYNNISKDFLVERAKELECLYLIDEALTSTTLAESLLKISGIISLGFRNVYACTVVITFDGETYCQRSIPINTDELGSAIMVSGELRGYIRVMYPKNTFSVDDIVFLDQEIRLLNTIARRISDVVNQRATLTNYHDRSRWEAIIDLLQKTDHELLNYSCEKMLSHLSTSNPNLVMTIYQEMNWAKYDIQGEINYPLETIPAVDMINLSNILFSSARKCLTDTQIYNFLSLWVYQGKTYQLIKIVDKQDSDVRKISQALKQYLRAVKSNEMSSEATKRWLKVELTRRFLTNNPKLIGHVQAHISFEAFGRLLDTFVCSPKSIGKIGGKGTGLFLAYQIIESYKEILPNLTNIKLPKTWYISSDELVYLIENNGLDELNEHKYRDITDLRTSYPRIIQMLKNAKMSPYVMNELNCILDDCNNQPLIIRSSSLLEDQVDSSFSGKYKSLFITNTGTKAERLKQLTDGILEVYASIFNPDSIQYRKERNLLDCSEQMGILIQEVVGKHVGPYYFPLYAGVAFSNNELRWSPRIKREDGLLRMVMGLGTRAVDRIGDDFPMLLSPGQPNLRVNHSPIELLKYSPQYMDVLDTQNHRFSSLSIEEIVKEYGNQIPNLHQIASVFKNDFIMDANKFTSNYKEDKILITFDALINNSPMIKQVNAILHLLQEKLGYPVDIEFASDGENFYLLQCRPQSRNRDNAPVAIPIDIPAQSTIFTANKYISNGKVTGIKTVVYVDPMAYSNLKEYDDLLRVGSAISELNRLLPRRSFILMGPGRWGSRGDIKLGVPVAYGDINNTAMLIEVATKESKHEPELSFGTHFFQDLVEENIKYLPLYPEDHDTIFNHSFFRHGKNFLSRILPAYEDLQDVIKVINVEETYYGKELQILMSADLEKAIAYLDHPIKSPTTESQRSLTPVSLQVESNDQGWKWRHFMAEQVANQLDLAAYGVDGIYLFGSTNNCTANLGSDIDLLIHWNGTADQKNRLTLWLDGWSKAIAQINYLKTGHKSDGLLDVHFVTDEDIRNKSSYAIKINSVFDPAYPLRINKAAKRP